MAVSFNAIPAGNGIRVPLFYAEMDNAQANYPSETQKTLLIGQKTKATAGTPYLIGSYDEAKDIFGVGSMLAQMVKFYRLQDPVGELWCLAVLDDADGVKATGTIEVGGTALVAGTIALYIAGQKITVGVADDDTANEVAAAINVAINAANDLPVVSTVSTDTVTIECLWKGLTGNDITVVHSFRGTAGGEGLPGGLTLTISGSGKLTGGTTAPDFTSALLNMGDDAYDFIIHPYTDTDSLDTFQTEMNESAGRWAWSRQVFGHVYTALRGSSSALVTAGTARNDAHNTIAAIDSDCQNPSWEYAAAYGGRNAVFIKADPARPTQTGALVGLLAPRQGRKFSFTNRNTLLSSGIATSAVVAGQLQIERAITTYQVNAYDQADISYLDSETLHTAAYVLRYLRGVITSKYPRHKLADDGTRYAPGQAIVTPLVIRGELLAAYKQLESLGIVENFDAFNEHLIVERDTTNANRVNVLFPPDYVNQLRVFAVLNQFRLQYQAA